MLLKKTITKRRAALICATLGALVLLSAAGEVSAAPRDLKNNAPPFIRHDLTNIICEQYVYSYITATISTFCKDAEVGALVVINAILPIGSSLFVSCNNGVKLIGTVVFGTSLSNPLYTAITPV